MIVRETIVQELRDRLAAIRPTTLNSRFAVVESGPIDVSDQGQSVIETGHIETRYSLGIDVQAAVGAADDAAAASAMNALYAAVIRAVMADPVNLGLAVVESVEEGSLELLDADGSSSAVRGFRLGFDVQFINRNNDPGVAP